MWYPWRALLLAALLVDVAMAMKQKENDEGGDEDGDSGSSGTWDLGGLEKSLKEGGVSGLASMLSAFSAVPDHSSEENAAMHIKQDESGHDMYDFRNIGPSGPQKTHTDRAAQDDTHTTGAATSSNSEAQRAQATDEEVAKEKAAAKLAAKTPAQVLAESQKLMDQMRSVVPSKEPASAAPQVSAPKPPPAVATPARVLAPAAVVAPVTAPVVVPTVAAVSPAAMVAAVPQVLAEPIVGEGANSVATLNGGIAEMRQNIASLSASGRPDASGVTGQLLLRLNALETVSRNVQSEEQMTAARVSALEADSRANERSLEESLGEEHGRNLRNGEEIEELRGDLEESRREVSGLRAALAARGLEAGVPAPKVHHTSLLSLESHTVTQHHARKRHHQRWTRRVMHHRKKPSSQTQQPKK